MKNWHWFILFVSVFQVLFALKGKVPLSCQKWHGLPRDCNRECPESFRPGKCLLFKGEKQCVCEAVDGDKHPDLYMVEDAKEIHNACNDRNFFKHTCDKFCEGFANGKSRCDNTNRGRYHCLCESVRHGEWYTLREVKIMKESCMSQTKNIEGCRSLCPSEYAPACEELSSTSKSEECVCKRDNDPEFYTVSEAQANSGCDKTKDSDYDGCKTRCPRSFPNGRCDISIKPGKRPWECFCSLENGMDEWYPIRKANEIATVCGIEKTNDKGCHSLCPSGYESGQCYDYRKSGVNMYRKCGCKKKAKDTLSYTIKKAEDMQLLCDVSNKFSTGCSLLCSEYGFEKGACHRRQWWDYVECFCSTEYGNGKWVSLKVAKLVADESISDEEARIGGNLPPSYIQTCK